MNVKLAEMLMSRMAHELAGPVSAIANGIEFMQEVEEGAEDAVELIGDSAKRAASRLQFYRMAYGGAGRATRDENVVRDIARGFVDEGGVVLNWPDGAATDLLEREGGAKLLLTVIEIARGTLLRGGEVRLSQDGGAVFVEAEGPKPTMPEEVRSRLSSRSGQTEDDITARSVHCLYAHLLADEARVALSLAEAEECVSIKVALSGAG